MANDGQIVFEVTADGKHAIADIKEITRAIQTESKNWDKSAKESTDNISNQFTGMLKKLVAGFSAVKIGKALLDIGKEAISAASDLQEVQNVVDVTFGDGASKIEAWSKTAGTQFGLTETQAKKFASTMGAMMKSSGLAGEQIVDMSTDLAGLAADMASFYNLDFDTAFQKIRSGISGETEPLKQLGINMSVANLNAYALQQGLSKTFEQMTQGEQTMLRYQYMMAATADAQGDFSRTSTGYANSLRTLETNLETLKTKLGEVLLPFINDLLGAANDLFKDRSGEPTIFDRFKTIDLDTEGKLAEIKKIADEANALIVRLDLIAENDSSPAGEQIEKALAAGSNSEEAVQNLVALGLSTDQIKDKQKEWLKTCKDLVKTIPGLSEIINTETGEVKGGVDAVRKYVDEWQTAQEKFAYWKAYYAKEDAQKEAQNKIYGLELDIGSARQAVKDQEAYIEELRKRLGIGVEGYELVIKTNAVGGQGILTKEEKEWNEAIRQRGVLLGKVDKAEEAYADAIDENLDAILDLKRRKQYLIDKFGEEEEAAESAAEAVTTLGKAEQGDADALKTVTTAVDNANEALQQMADYAESVHTAVKNAVDSVVSGFSRMESPTQSVASQISELTDQLHSGKITAEEYDTQCKKLNKSLDEQGVTVKGMTDNLKSQATFLSEYMKYLEEARNKGVSNAVLAELSDGSAESADRLKALAGASVEEIADINELYSDVQRGKEQLSEALTQQKLSADSVYKSMAQTAKEAGAALDLEGEAKNNSGKTVAGMAAGISEHVSDVQSAVDSIITQLNRLNNWGININFGGFGRINFTTSAGKVDGNARGGWDFIPRDDFLMRLHEGEGVLTAEENRVWHGIKSGGFGTDELEALTGAVSAGVKPGGNVYLDGKIVGQVISDQQGKAYRQLTRSGWQGG